MTKKKNSDPLGTMGGRIKTARGKLSMTQEAFCEKYEYNRSNLAKIEAGGKNLKATEIMWFAERLKVSSDYLLGLSLASSKDVEVQAVAKKYGLSDKSLETLEALAAPPPKSLPQEWLESGFRILNSEDVSENNKTLLALINDATTRRDCLSMLNSLLSWWGLKELLLRLYAFTAFNDTGEKANIIAGCGTLTDHTTYDQFEVLQGRLRRMLEMFRDDFQAKSFDTQDDTKTKKSNTKAEGGENGQR